LQIQTILGTCRLAWQPEKRVQARKGNKKIVVLLMNWILLILVNGPWQENGKPWGSFVIFPALRIKVLNVCHQVTLYTFVMALGSAVMAPALPQIAKKYGTIDRPGGDANMKCAVRYHGLCDSGDDALDFLSLAWTGTAGSWTVI